MPLDCLVWSNGTPPFNCALSKISKPHPGQRNAMLATTGSKLPIGLQDPEGYIWVRYGLESCKLAAGALDILEVQEVQFRTYSLAKAPFKLHL